MIILIQYARGKGMGTEIVAMLLAGGKGTRLEALTKKIAKPAVSYGGKYRIIDFPLSNCAHSGIDTVGVLTQYESVFLNMYIGNGEKWGLNGVRSLTATLPPRQTEEGASWYKGTADAIFQNIDFLDSIKPDYVLILSGDHIYKMNYRAMLQAHQLAEADLTVAAIEVQASDTSRFGMITMKDKSVIEKFEEKPLHTKSRMASMGIYIFNYKVLKQILIEDSQNDTSEHDFGKNIIPKLLAEKKKLIVYPFQGYWRDVGTIQSLWEANMDLLNPTIAKEIFADDIKIFSENINSVPQYIGPTALVTQSRINQGAIVLGKVHQSIVFNDALIEEGAFVSESVIMPGAIIEVGAIVKKAIIAPHTRVEAKRIIDGGKTVVLVGG
jgi:glucose-1-phosphate adenylyltransferase